jgi:hypothetical protein
MRTLLNDVSRLAARLEPLKLTPSDILLENLIYFQKNPEKPHLFDPSSQIMNRMGIMINSGVVMMVLIDQEIPTPRTFI